jgi:hypothetical protein
MPAEYEINNFLDNFENLELDFSEILIQNITDMTSPLFYIDSGYTNVWENLDISFLDQGLYLEGTILLFLKNQNESMSDSLLLNCKVKIKVKNEIDKANVFTKSLQFLFQWANLFVIEKNIVSKYGNKFIIPDFLYSKHHFENHFA